MFKARKFESKDYRNKEQMDGAKGLVVINSGSVNAQYCQHETFDKEEMLGATRLVCEHGTFRP